LVRILETGANFWLAVVEIILATTGFICLLMYLKPIKKEAKAKKKLQAEG
jgi:uncharacterized membrane protein